MTRTAFVILSEAKNLHRKATLRLEILRFAQNDAVRLFCNFSVFSVLSVVNLNYSGHGSGPPEYS